MFPFRHAIVELRRTHSDRDPETRPHIAGPEPARNQIRDFRANPYRFEKRHKKADNGLEIYPILNYHPCYN